MNNFPVRHHNQLARLKKIEGQIKGIQNMINQNRECVDILIQIKSAQSALKKVGENVMKQHIEECVNTAIESKKSLKTKETLDELMGMISKFS